MFFAAILDLYAVTVIVDTWLHHTKRITRYYVTRETQGVLMISHEPLGWYRQEKREFFEDRAMAYACIARSLPDHIHTVKSESVWLDYAQEGWQVSEKQNTPMKRLLSVYFYWLNAENCNREPGPSWYAIGHSTYRCARMTREQFVTRFGEGEA